MAKAKQISQTVYKTTADIIYRIFNDKLTNKEVLASLRNSKNILTYTAIPARSFMLEMLDPALLSKNADGTPSYAENAIFTALQAFAVFQQGKDNSVNGAVYKQEGIPLFTALGRVRELTLKSKIGLDRRVNRVLSTKNFDAACTGILSLEKIMKGQKFDFKIDFALLAQDLYKMQFNPASQKKIAFKWGQEYFNQVYKLSD